MDPNCEELFEEGNYRRRKRRAKVPHHRPLMPDADSGIRLDDDCIKDDEGSDDFNDYNDPRLSSPASPSAFPHHRHIDENNGHDDDDDDDDGNDNINVSFPTHCTDNDHSNRQSIRWSKMEKDEEEEQEQYGNFRSEAGSDVLRHRSSAWEENELDDGDDETGRYDNEKRPYYDDLKRHPSHSDGESDNDDAFVGVQNQSNKNSFHQPYDDEKKHLPPNEISSSEYGITKSRMDDSYYNTNNGKDYINQTTGTSPNYERNNVINNDNSCNTDAIRVKEEFSESAGDNDGSEESREKKHDLSLSHSDDKLYQGVIGKDNGCLKTEENDNSIMDSPVKKLRPNLNPESRSRCKREPNSLHKLSPGHVYHSNCEIDKSIGESQDNETLHRTPMSKFKSDKSLRRKSSTLDQIFERRRTKHDASIQNESEKLNTSPMSDSHILSPTSSSPSTHYAGDQSELDPQNKTPSPKHSLSFSIDRIIGKDCDNTNTITSTPKTKSYCNYDHTRALHFHRNNFLKRDILATNLNHQDYQDNRIMSFKSDTISVNNIYNKDDNKYNDNNINNTCTMSNNNDDTKTPTSTDLGKRKRDVFEGIPNPPPKVIDLKTKSLEYLPFAMMPAHGYWNHQSRFPLGAVDPSLFSVANQHLPLDHVMMTYGHPLLTSPFALSSPSQSQQRISGLSLPRGLGLPYML